MVFNSNKNISSKEIVKNTLYTIKLNYNAIDYCVNEINRTKDILEYNENCTDAKYNLDILEYIKQTLNFLGTKYKENIKKLGGVVVD